jgi:2-polyprenyl-3-methyl-5-hydroxy-6-metoxy-1,4-benzoquinol methylase
MLTDSPATIDEAFAEVGRCLSDGGDRTYFTEHAARYRHCVNAVRRLVPPGARVLDVGAHYLHQSALLRLLGYEVWAVDVPEFTELPFVARRALDLGIRLCPVRDLEKERFLPGEEHRFDLVLFCEILEHISFNPIGFWHRVYELMRVGGKLYITTPNSLRLINVASTVKRALTLDGVGVGVPTIFGNVTYGHHWKEYSRGEIEAYFRALSPDFQVDVGFYHYRVYPVRFGVKDLARSLARWLGTRVARFDEELEAVVTLARRTGFSARPPAYG